MMQPNPDPGYQIPPIDSCNDPGSQEIAPEVKKEYISDIGQCTHGRREGRKPTTLFKTCSRRIQEVETGNCPRAREISCCVEAPHHRHGFRDAPPLNLRLDSSLRHGDWEGFAWVQLQQSPPAFCPCQLFVEMAFNGAILPKLCGKQ